MKKPVKIAAVGILSAACISVVVGLASLIRKNHYDAGAIANQPYSELETKLFVQARTSTFRVIAHSVIGGGRWMGTAFLASINNRLVVVTAGHVCNGDDTTYALDQEADLFATNVIAVSETADICFMSVSSRIAAMHPYVLKNAPVIVGKQLAAIGHAFGGRLTQYLIKATGTQTVDIGGDTRTFIVAIGAVYPGQSGGPVVDNIDGTAVALISATNTETNHAYVTPATDIILEFNRLVKDKSTNVTFQ